MLNLDNFILEKLKINSKSIVNKDEYKLGDIVEYKDIHNNKTYKAICCIPQGYLEDRKPRFILKNQYFFAKFDENEFDLGSGDESDINGFNNTTNIIINNDKYGDVDTAADTIRKEYGYKAYIPAIGELIGFMDYLNELINDYDYNLKNLQRPFMSSTQYNKSKIYCLQPKNNKTDYDISHKYKPTENYIIPFVQI